MHTLQVISIIWTVETKVVNSSCVESNKRKASGPAPQPEMLIKLGKQHSLRDKMPFRSRASAGPNQGRATGSGDLSEQAIPRHQSVPIPITNRPSIPTPAAKSQNLDAVTKSAAQLVDPQHKSVACSNTENNVPPQSPFRQEIPQKSLHETSEQRPLTKESPSSMQVKLLSLRPFSLPAHLPPLDVSTVSCFALLIAMEVSDVFTKDNERHLCCIVWQHWYWVGRRERASSLILSSNNLAPFSLSSLVWFYVICMSCAVRFC